jgi:hypothetical protein
MRFLFIGFCLCTLVVSAQPKTDSFLKSLLKSNPAPILQQVISDPQTYRCQIIYTQINRDKKNKPSFTNYYFNYDPQNYFNPASMVKLPLAALSLEKLNRLKKKGITKETAMQFDSSYEGQTIASKDTTSASGLPSIAHYIRRAFLISENEPYNRMYQFVGQQAINRALHQKGYTQARIIRQFAGFTDEGNRHTNGLRFIKGGSIIYSQPPAYNTDAFDLSRSIKIGKGHWNRNDSLIMEPFDFTAHNNLSLYDLQQILQSIIFPKSVPPKQRFRLAEKDRQFLLQYLSQYPSETPYPKYDTSLFYDSYVKFFFRDSTKKMQPYIRVFNKVGWSYGFLTDVSYVVDFEHKVEYMLAATVYVNSDEILNDGKYDYDTIGYPFLYQLGQVIYKYELGRKRSMAPNLSNLKMAYEHRDVNDKRPPIKEVDN